MKRTVYLAMRGLYSDRHPCGIYPSAEAAIADLHQDGWTWTRTLWHYGSANRGGSGWQLWYNDQGWENAISIDVYEYDDEAINQRSPDRIIAAWDVSPTRIGSVEIDADTARRITEMDRATAKKVLTDLAREAEERAG